MTRKIKPFEKLFWDNAVGLGDAIVLNGAIRHWAELCEILYYPARAAYFDTLNCLYQDVANVEVWRFFDDSQHDVFILSNNIPRIRVPPLITTRLHRINCEEEYIHINWPQQVYESINVPFHMRYTNFKLPNYIPGEFELYDRLTEGTRNYALVHRRSGTNAAGIDLNYDPYHGTNIQNLKVIEIQEGQTSNLLNYMKLIRNAKEIHCIASSFFNLVDSVCKDIPARCFFHDARKNSIMQVNSRWNDHRWTIIDYSTRN